MSKKKKHIPQSSLFHGKSLEEVISERHAFRDALLSNVTSLQEREKILTVFSGGDSNITRIFNGDKPPSGSVLTRASATSPYTGIKYLWWSVEIKSN